jgi:hypothetical protein
VNESWADASVTHSFRAQLTEVPSTSFEVPSVTDGGAGNQAEFGHKQPLVGGAQLSL